MMKILEGPRDNSERFEAGKKYGHHQTGVRNPVKRNKNSRNSKTKPGDSKERETKKNKKEKWAEP